jgi:4-hydroxy-tetrahydrodipicolinate synthase
MVIYNVPGRTSCNISAETTLRLARDCDNIMAIKEASGNLAQIMEILRDRPEGFRVLSGDDAMTFPMIALGADGLISVASNEAPELMARMVHLALEGNWDEARSLHYRLLPLMELNFIESSPGPVKAGLAMMNIIGENYRLPMVPIQEKSRALLRVALLELGLLHASAAAAPAIPV